MKKYLVLLLTIFALNGCEEDTTIIDATADKKMDKVKVCHYDAATDTWETLHINGNALKAHLGHGDYEGECSDLVEICHYDVDTKTWETISIRENKLEEHLEHGDYEGECKECISIDWDISVIPNSQLLDNTTQPSLYDGTIAWHDGTTNGNLFYWNGSLTKVVANGVFAGPISLYNGQISYPHMEGVNNGVRTYFWDGINSHNIAPEIWGNRSELYDGKIVMAGPKNGSSTDRGLYIWDGLVVKKLVDLQHTYYPTLYENTVSWIDVGKLFYYDGEKIITVYEGRFDNKISLFDGQIAFSAHDGNDYEIYLWDGNKILQITDNEVDDKKPSLYNGEIAWEAILGETEWSREIFFWDGKCIHQVTDNLIPDQYPSLYEGNIAWNSGSAWNGTGQISYATQKVDVILP